MELNTATIDTPPRDAASVVLLRDAPPGLEVLLMRRHAQSQVLGGAYVFPGGKLERSDSTPLVLDRLDAQAQALHGALGEPGLTTGVAAGLFVAALREAFEESGVLFASERGAPLNASVAQQAVRDARAGESFNQLLQMHDWQLDTHALAPWSRWITPRRPSVMNRRFDTRFFLAALPSSQQARSDDHEITEARWLTPRAALQQYEAHQIDLAPPQIISLMHLLTFSDVDSALKDARSRPPPLVEPHSLELGAERIMCYPGDPDHPVTGPALPTATRLIWRDRRFQPPEGFSVWLNR